MGSALSVARQRSATARRYLDTRGNWSLTQSALNCQRHDRSYRAGVAQRRRSSRPAQWLGRVGGGPSPSSPTVPYAPKIGIGGNLAVPRLHTTGHTCHVPGGSTGLLGSRDRSRSVATACPIRSSNAVAADFYWRVTASIARPSPGKHRQLRVRTRAAMRLVYFHGRRLRAEPRPRPRPLNDVQAEHLRALRRGRS